MAIDGMRRREGRGALGEDIERLPLKPEKGLGFRVSDLDLRLCGLGCLGFRYEHLQETPPIPAAIH